ncbi:MAG TPA: hypothetical protein VFQ05_02550 [Candidatus Eisenbacteria bacterium]|nr:hypothetical protein [Candidatus Eisenbacteria bacterium]
MRRADPGRSSARRLAAGLTALALLSSTSLWAQLVPVVPPSQRGGFESERSGTHDAANIRTVFWNFGMVGDFPSDPGNVDLSVFHSAEVPKGTGMNYSDGITPFVLAKVRTGSGDSTFIMETGFRERQAQSPFSQRIMRFEPRPGYFQPDPVINRGRSPAISHDPRTWPTQWPDKLNDPDDPGWAGAWDGYFGKRPAADQESFTVMDDNYYDAFDFYPDTRDSTRRGLGLRVNVRGFQWANPQAGNVIFWHYDITNESTTDYDDNIVFGLYMDSGVGGSALSCDGIFESDDDNAYFDKSLGLNLVYTWDRYGHGRDLSGLCGRTGYLGYAYLETPGNALNGLDDDADGFVDERREGGRGVEITGQTAILAYWAAHYDTSKFTAFYGSVADRPAYRLGRWWTGDEDMDWRADFNDFGADGVPDTDDSGEEDGMPTEGEANFDRTDLNESDQIGLTGFKMNRIRAGAGNPDQSTDGILFYSDDQNWPMRLYGQFSHPNPAARFDTALASNYNIGFLFASGPFTLKAGKTERFSLALAYGADLTELRETVHTVQLIYNANYQFAVPPPPPVVRAETGDRYVRLSWTDHSERAFDPVTNEFDFEGYRIYRSTDPDFLDVKVVTDGRGNGPLGNGKPIAQFDLDNDKRGFSRKTINGVAYWLGENTGITHTWTDTTVTNGQQYYYAVCAYDFGRASDIDSLAIYPSENSIPVSRTLRGGLILPVNVVTVRPNARVQGFGRASASAATHVTGTGRGTVDVEVVNSDSVRDGRLYSITFTTPHPDSFEATAYTMRDSTNHRTLFETGRDFEAEGTGAVGDGLLPRVYSPPSVSVDLASSGFDATSTTTMKLRPIYQLSLSSNEKRVGYPDDIRIEFSDTIQDTSVAIPNSPLTAITPARFRIFAETPQGDVQLDFGFRDVNGDRTLSHSQDRLTIVTYSNSNPTFASATWAMNIDTLGTAPTAGDVYHLRLIRPLNVTDQFTFTTTGARIAGTGSAGFVQEPYVVPNPYVGSASFEPARFAVSGRGERRIEFRAVPLNSTIRIYTVGGDLVQTLKQDGSTAGYVAWNLRTKDNLDVAPGLYIFHVDAPGVGSTKGKFALLK